MNLYCIARVIEVFASFDVDCNIRKIFPLSVMIVTYTHTELLSVLSVLLISCESQEGRCLYHTHVAVDYIRAYFHVSVPSQETSYSCYIQSLLIWGGGRGSPGLVCNFPAWLMPPAHHRKAKARPDIYL